MEVIIVLIPALIYAPNKGLGGWTQTRWCEEEKENKYLKMRKKCLDILFAAQSDSPFMFSEPCTKLIHFIFSELTQNLETYLSSSKADLRSSTCTPTQFWTWGSAFCLTYAHEFTSKQNCRDQGWDH